MAGNKTKKKGRQNVKRHWKPSLGRFVDQYDRTGEHARRKEMRAAHEADADVPTPAAPAKRPRLGRRLLISGAGFVIMLAVIGGFRLAREGTREVEYDVLVAAKPVVVKIDHGSPTRVLTAPAAEFKELVRAAIASVRATASEHPQRLIVIDPVAPPVSFSSLRAADQLAAKKVAGADAAHVYETAVARFLENVITGVANPRVSILGLPVEPGAAGVEVARQTNRTYAGLIKRLDHLVTGHIFFRTESWLTERRMVEEAIPEALHRAEGRPIVFRLNLEWRVLVDRTQVGRYRRAEWNVVQKGTEGLRD